MTKKNPMEELRMDLQMPDFEESEPVGDAGDRQISILDSISPAESHRVMQLLLAYESRRPGVPIHLYLFSPGGCVNSGLAIIDVMEHITSPVFTYCTGYAASMAAVILAAGEKDYRYILPHSRVMIHQTMSSVQGTLDNVRSMLNLQNALEVEIEEILARKTGKTMREIHEETRFDKWFSATEAQTFGIVDHILHPFPRTPIH